MKISCQSCQAKYTIADEKVLGKIVKIRCKKCGATIVINGNETTAAGASSASPSQMGEEAPANVFDYSAQAPTGDQWTVNVADGDQRTMTAQEIVAEFRTGVVNEETFCWKDGMGDWLPLREIDELYAQCTTAGGGGDDASLSPDQTHQEPGYPHQDEPPAAAPSQRPGYLFGGGGGGGGLSAPASVPPPNGNGLGGALFASSAPAATAARRQGGRGGGGADLFGGVSQAGGEEDVMTSAPAGMPQVSNDPGKMTGQRNENSVLFSLNALTQNAPKDDAAPPPGEGSGLIDIRALSATMGGEKASSKNHIDDIMNLGGGGAFSAALAAPVLAPPSMDTGAHEMGGTGAGKNQKVMLIAIVGGAALIALAIILVFALKKPEPPPATALLPAAVPVPTDPIPAGQATAPAPTDSSAAGAPPSTAAAPGTGQALAAAKPPAGGAVGAHTTHGGGGGASPGTNDSKPPPAFVPPPTPPAPAGKGSFDQQLKSAVGAPDTPATPAAPQGGSAPFDRGAAAAALSAINVASCHKADGPTGSGHVRVTFGPSGQVQSAVVDQPPFAGTPVGGCVAGKFRSAHIPAFSGGPVPVGKSFVIN